VKFYISKIILWLKDGSIRSLKFEKNKVNVITGNSDTGKSTILEIIDYCFLGSKSEISPEHIGENVKWYGMNLHINDKNFTIARGEIIGRKLSETYYFSGSGVIPKIPYSTIDGTRLRGIIEKEFGINEKVIFPFGGKYIKPDTKISFRYFWMFNTQSGDVISSSKVYFDKQHEDRYREALPRIFDLATGITTVENLAYEEKIEQLEKEIHKLEKKQKEKVAASERMDEKISNLITKAKQFRIIPIEINNIDTSYSQLVEIIRDSNKLGLVDIEKTNVYDDLVEKRQRCLIQIRNLNSFKERYKNYKKGLEKEADSLKPVEYLKKYINNIQNDEYKTFLRILEMNLLDIKSSIESKMPFEVDVEDELKELELKFKNIDMKIKQYPVNQLEGYEEKSRYIALGEIKSEFNRVENSPLEKSNDEILLRKREELEEAENRFISLEESRLNTIQALNEYVTSYIEECPDVFDTYKNYKAAFDYKYKVLNLRKDKSADITGHTSSSVDLFRHLCLFMGMHEMIDERQVPYVAPFIIIDQPSRPYFNRKSSIDYRASEYHTEQKDDWTKVRRIFKLLNQFMKNMINKNKEMQIIVLEHVAVDAWKDCSFVHLVEEFDGDINALIPVKM